MQFVIKIHAIKSGWYIVFIDMSLVINSKTKFERLSLKIVFIYSNSEDLDEMLLNAAFHLGLHCLSKYAFNVCGLQRVCV